MKNKLADIDEILAKSQRLTTHNGFGSSPAGARSVTRGVAELTEFSKQWGKEGNDEQNNLDAFRLLSQKNFDARKLFEDVSSINVKAGDDSAMRLEGTDIEGYLAHQHDMIILTAIEEAKQGAEDHVQEMQRRWAANEWSEARHKFMESLGHRAYRWEGQVAATPGKGFEATLGTPFSPQGAPPSAAKYMPPRTPFGGGIAALDHRQPLSDLLGAQAQVIRRMNLSSHAGVQASSAAGLLSSGQREPVTAVVKPFSLLANSVHVPEQGMGRAMVSDGLSKAELVAYKSHLQLLASAVGEINVQCGGATVDRAVLTGGVPVRVAPSNFSSAGPTDAGVAPSGYFSTICLDPTDFAHSSASSQLHATEERRQWLTLGVKAYLENQYWDVLSHALDEAVRRDSWQVLASSEGSSHVQRLRSYVTYLHHSRQLPAQCARVMVTAPVAAAELFASPTTPRHRSTNSALVPSSSSTGTPLWVFVYYCLRTGDLASVAAELSACMTRGHCEGGAAALTVVQSMIQLLSPAPAATSRAGARSQRANSVSLSEQEVRSLVEAMQQCRAQYERESQADDNTCDPYRQVVFNLLGLSNKDDLAGSAVPGFSLEDFLWSHLWFVQWVRLLQPAVGNNAFSTPLVASERGLFELVLEFGGPDYFDEDRSNPFRYAMVLVCCQRYGDAIAHLWQCNKVLPAVHLACAALHYGLILPHVPLDMNPAHPMIMGGRFVTGASYATTQDPTPASVLQFFVSTPLVAAYPAVAADYVVSLDSNWLSHAQGLDSELKESSKLKSQSLVSGVLESFVTSLTRDQLAEIVGTPATSAGATAGGMRGATRTSGGRLDDYLSPTQVDLLLARSAYHLLTQRKEAEAAIYLYLLSGRYQEAVEEMCTQLAAVLVPPSNQPRGQGFESKREHWRKLSEDFIEKYVRGADGAAAGNTVVVHALTVSGGRALIDTLLLLNGLFLFVDNVYSANGNAGQSLKMLDQLQVFPANEQQVDNFAAFSPFLRPVMDDLLLVVMECITKSYQAAQLERTRSTTSSGAGYFAGLLTDKDVQIRALKQRAAAMVSFALKIKSTLNRQDTVGILSRMESAFV